VILNIGRFLLQDPLQSHQAVEFIKPHHPILKACGGACSNQLLEESFHRPGYGVGAGRSIGYHQLGKHKGLIKGDSAFRAILAFKAILWTGGKLNGPMIPKERRPDYPVRNDEDGVGTKFEGAQEDHARVIVDIGRSRGDYVP